MNDEDRLAFLADKTGCVRRRRDEGGGGWEPFSGALSAWEYNPKLVAKVLNALWHRRKVLSKAV